MERQGGHFMRALAQRKWCGPEHRPNVLVGWPWAKPPPLVTEGVEKMKFTGGLFILECEVLVLWKN